MFLFDNVKSADYSTSYGPDPAKIGMWVWPFRPTKRLEMRDRIVKNNAQVIYAYLYI